MSRWPWAFTVYAAGLFIATHWPKLRVEGPLPRTDLWIHVVAFGAWTLLLGMTGWVRKAGTAAGLATLWAIGAAYGVLDEVSQGIPVLGRTVAWEDALANIGGATLGVVAFAIVRAMRKER